MQNNFLKENSMINNPFINKCADNDSDCENKDCRNRGCKSNGNAGIKSRLNWMNKSGKLAWEYIAIIVIVLMVVFVMIAFSIFAKDKSIAAFGELLNRIMGR